MELGALWDFNGGEPREGRSRTAGMPWAGTASPQECLGPCPLRLALARELCTNLILLLPQQLRLPSFCPISPTPPCCHGYIHRPSPASTGAFHISPQPCPGAIVTRQTSAFGFSLGNQASFLAQASCPEDPWEGALCRGDAAATPSSVPVLMT